MTAHAKTARTVEGRALRTDWVQLTGYVVEVWLEGDAPIAVMAEENHGIIGTLARRCLLEK